MADRELLVRILGDDRQLQQTFTKTERSTAKLQGRTAAIGSTLKSGFAAAGVVIGSQQLIRGIEASVDAASNLNEQISKSRAVFGEASAGVEKWAQTTSSSLGIANDQALEATGTFGNLFRTVGIGGAEAAAMSQRLVTLAADLASFNNASPEDALLALRSGLVGEAEPLRRFGVLLSETRVAQQAMSDTGKTNVATLTAQEKALARYELILRDTAPAQGDFARTSGGLANQQRILAANLRDLEANIGGVLIPFLVRLADTANIAAEALKNLGGIKIGGESVTDLVGWIGGWKEIGFLIDKAKGDAADLKQTIATTDFSKIQPGQIPGQPELPFGTFPVLPAAPGPKPGPKFTGPFAELDRQQAEARRQALAASRAVRESRRRFDAFVSGLGLKLKNAELTTTDFSDDLAVLRQVEAAIVKQIAREGRTFKLANDLADVRSRIATVTAAISSQAADRTRNAFAAIIASVDLRIDRATFTPQLDDDVAALEELNTKIANEIRVEGKTADLLSQQEDARQRLVTARAGLAQQRQFTALGLSLTGAERVPGVRALRRRGQSLSKQIEGTTLDTPKTRRELARISKVLSGEFGKVGDDVRSAILAMFNKITTALQAGSKGTGKALTPFRVVNTSEVLGGLGLDVEQTQRLRRRLSRLGPGGTTPQAGGPGGAFGFSTNSGVVINGNVTVIAKDPEDFGRKLDKKKRRTTTSRSGPNSGRGL
jgi:hypothetical protein